MKLIFRRLRIIAAMIGLMTLGVTACSTRLGNDLRAGQGAARASEARRPVVTITNGPPEFRQYDQEFCTQVQNRWYDLLDAFPYKQYRTGEVIVDFKLHEDGRISEVMVKKNSASEELAVLCEKAILDPQPYERWPAEMRLRARDDFRRITFSFDYQR